MIRLMVLGVFILVANWGSIAQNDEYFNSQYLRLENHAYRENVRSVVMHPQNWPLAQPIYRLNDDVPLELHFDILDEELGNYMYTIIHCDYNWEKSELDYQEYIDGPTEDFIFEYEYSRNTFQRFIQYKIDIPNSTIRLTKSGNYVIKVFEEGDQNQLILTRRFSVVEEISPVSLSATVRQATMVRERYSHQEVDFKIFTGNYEITNPYSDLKVVVLQNHTWESALYDLKPRFVKNNELDYDYDGENTFLGLNEFRLFDIKDTRFTGQGIERMEIVGNENHAYLELDRSRSSLTYLQRQDINGWFFIKNDRLGSVDHADADYVHTHFSLERSAPVANGNVYIFGALTDWKIKPEARMTYNAELERFENTLYLKQGLYNYMYVLADDYSQNPDLSYISGSHFETENEYTILVYHRQLGFDYDQLIAVGDFSFGNN